MRRYLAFGGNYTPERHMRDFLGDFDQLLDAKAKAAERDEEGYPIWDWGTVLDTQTGQAHDWTTDGRPYGKDEWRFPVQLEARF